jgi:hypothetical protein
VTIETAALRDAVALQGDINSRCAQIEADPTLSDEGRDRALVRATQGVDERVSALAQSHVATLESFVRDAHISLYGAPLGREAELRSAVAEADRAITSPADALRLLRRYRDTGDTLGERAVAKIADERGFGAVVVAYAEGDPTRQAALERKLTAEREIHSPLNWRGAFHNPVPVKVRNMPKWRKDAILAEAGLLR